MATGIKQETDYHGKAIHTLLASKNNYKCATIYAPICEPVRCLCDRTRCDSI